MSDPSWSIAVPSVGRASLRDLLRSLGAQEHLPAEVVVVDDRPGVDDTPSDAAPLDRSELAGCVGHQVPIRVLTGGGKGPAHARNVGWRATSGTWVVFLDDDVVLPADWSRGLMADLRRAEADSSPTVVAGSQARIVVPGPSDGRRLSDAERATAGLVGAAWVTADMAYRRDALHRVGGFDERFPRAFREDSDLAIRVMRAGFRIVRGERTTIHPLRAEDRSPRTPRQAMLSVIRQRGNADDALMLRLHGRGWRAEACAPQGRLWAHTLTVGLAAGCGLALLRGRRRGAVVLSAGWLGLTADFVARRVAPGPRDLPEVTAMLGTSVLIPFAALYHRLRGAWRHRRAEPWPGGLRGVLFDRDGTLVRDVPYNGDPERVSPVAGASAAIGRLREHGIRIGVITNQSGVARGLIDRGQVEAVNARIDTVLGPFDTWQICEHGPDARCRCRKPAPGMVHDACAELGLEPEQVAVIGDIGADVDAAHAAGARAVLVPNATTLPEERRRCRPRAETLVEAVEMVLRGAR